MEWILKSKDYLNFPDNYTTEEKFNYTAYDLLYLYNDINDATSWIGSFAETDPIFTAWLAGPPNISEFTNDLGYLTAIPSHGGTHTDGTDDVADMVGDSGAGGTHGLVPAPAIGDAVKYLKGDGSWDSPGGGNHDILSATHSDSVVGSSVLGDLITGNATPKWDKLSGQITTTKKFLTQTGTGVISALPVWNTISDSDIPAFADDYLDMIEINFNS